MSAITRRGILLGAVPPPRRPPNILLRPNIVLMMSDDQRPDTIHALGNRLIRTPNLDRLVHEGVAFTRATCANPLCVPSRAELITGVTGFRNGVLGGGRLRAGVPLLPETLRNHGYDTCYAGKWHHDRTPRAMGFTETTALYSGAAGRFAKQKALPDWKGREATGYAGWVFEGEDGVPHRELGVGLTPRISEHIASAACDYLRRPRQRPFFLQVAFTAPHDPLQFPPGFERMYDPARIPVPRNFLPTHPFDHGNLRGRDELLMEFPRTSKEVREELACYWAVITHLDLQVGRVLDTLGQAGIAGNTIVIFAADNGLAIGSHGLRGKQNQYEHSIGVPLLIRGPGIGRGRRSRAQCYLRDIFPTLCEAAGIEAPPAVRGQSLMPILAGKAQSVRGEAIGYFGDVQRMIRTDRWKLIRYPKIGREQLFDLRKDPDELHDLIADPGVAPLAAGLRKRLEEWLRAEGDA